MKRRYPIGNEKDILKEFNKVAKMIRANQWFIKAFSVSIVLYTLSSCDKEDFSTETLPAFTIEYPTDWTMNEAVISPVLSQGLSSEAGEEDGFIENVNIVNENALGFDLDQYVAANITALDSFFEGFELVSSKAITINNRQGHELVYQISPQSLMLKNIVHLYVNEGEAYVITASALEETFNDYELVFYDILNTFELL